MICNSIDMFACRYFFLNKMKDDARGEKLAAKLAELFK